MCPVNREAVKQNVCCEGQKDQRNPSAPVFGSVRMELENQPDKQRCQGCEHKKGVAGPPVISESFHGIGKGKQDVQVGKQTTGSAPHPRTPPDLSAQCGLANSST